jgi:formate--tetrahydrofolate ligase
MASDIEIAQSATLIPIQQIAAKLKIREEDLIPYGRFKAKVPLNYIDKEKAKNSKLILVTSISPTPSGEGKTTMSIGLAQGMNRIGKQTTVVLREPSLGPVFGMKGGAAGGGYSQVLPMEDINLHFTGDLNAIEKAHNLLATIIDNNIQNKQHSVNLDPRTIVWKRVMDMNDRSLRKIVVGLGGTANGIPRETGFDITAASEVMAILCLSDSLSDLKNRLGNIFIGFTRNREPIYARDLKVQGAMAALLKDALRPNLVQTLEGTPAIIHGGPFANIAQGTNSIIATRMGLSLSDYVVTEAGFGCDLGGEKFLNIKCVNAGFQPAAVVVVVTVRALKYHGGMPLKELETPDIESLEKGIVNLEKHLENLRMFNLPALVAINHFKADSVEEHEFIIDKCKSWGINAVVSNVWGKGGAGAEALAKAVVATSEIESGALMPTYDYKWPVKKKIEVIAQRIYGAKGVEYGPEALKALKRIDNLGLNDLAICMAKTQYSFSDNPKLLGRPSGFMLSIRDIEIAAGAGFLVPIAGEIMRMPGLPLLPAALNIDIDEEGNISGLF